MMPRYDELNNNGNQSNDEDIYETNDTDDYQELSTPLLNHLKREVERHPLQLPQSDRIHRNAALENLEVLEETNRYFLRDVFIFELCLMSVVLAFPLITQPLFTLHYTGSLVHLFEESVDRAVTFTFWDVIMTISKYNASGVFSLAVTVFVWLHTVILPILFWICCIVILLCMTGGKGAFAPRFVEFANLMHPLHYGTPFSISIIATVWFIEDVSRFVFDQNIICKFLQNLIHGEDNESRCLNISMTIQPGLIALLLQVLAMDVLIFFMKGGNIKHDKKS
jgi:hypothetical protein